MRVYLAGLFAVAEILALLVVGSVLGSLTAQALFGLVGVDADSVDLMTLMEEPTPRTALIAAIPIVSRFFWLLLIAFLVLRFIHGVRPREAGVGRGGHSRARLLGAGLLLAAVATLPQKLIFLADSYLDFGAGLEGWQLWSQLELTFAYLLFVLAAQVVLPPLFEEPLVRGYMRLRLTWAFGAVGGVVISAVLFMLAHGHFYQADGLVLAILASAIFAAVCWAWVAYRMGSVIPAIIAHAVYNIPFALEREVLLPVIGVMVLFALMGIRTVSREFGAFFREWSEAPKGPLVFGLGLVAICMLSIVAFEAAAPVVGLLALAAAIAGWFPPMRRWGAGR